MPELSLPPKPNRHSTQLLRGHARKVPALATVAGHNSAHDAEPGETRAERHERLRAAREARGWKLTWRERRR